MFYTLYKVTNLINGKIYIGKHQTKNLDDGYMGSGKRILRSISKYGIENFKKEILFIFETENQMNDKEKELVTYEFCLREDTYNLCPGGKGGWAYVNNNPDIRNGFETDNSRNIALRKRQKEIFTKKMKDEIFRSNFCEKVSAGLKKKYKLTPKPGIAHTEETKTKIGAKNAISQKGCKNSQHGTMWITDGISNKKISKLDTLPDGWKKGRIQKILPLQL